MPFAIMKREPDGDCAACTIRVLNGSLVILLSVMENDKGYSLPKNAVNNTA